jgi:translation initiation factor IF-2
VDIIHKGVGAMTESDVMLAAASKGIVIGFNVKPESGAEAAAKAEGVAALHLLDHLRAHRRVKAAMTGLLEPIRTEKKLGRAEVRNTFNVPGWGPSPAWRCSTASCAVVRRCASPRGQAGGGGQGDQPQRFKDDVREVEKGFECGIGVEGYTDFKNLDVIEAFEIEETRPSLF